MAHCHAEESRLGYFAALYRQVTVQVQLGIETGRFEDGPRMEQLDVVFANRYFEALRRHLEGELPTASWQVAFSAAPNWRPLVLQHLLLGMNAHINLDLGLSAAAVCPGDSISSLRADFYKINTILSDLLDIIQARIGDFSPLLDLLDRLGGKSDEAVFNFSMQRARDAAWRIAERFAHIEPEQHDEEITKIDRTITRLAQAVQQPGKLIRIGALLIRLFEKNDVRHIIDALNAPI